MKYHILFLFSFLTFGSNSQAQNKMFEKGEKKAIEFMESKITKIYNEEFNTEFIGTWHEFGKIYGFKFYIIENNDHPIAVEYNLGNQSPFEFDKEAFEKEYESTKVKIRASEELEKKVRTYYSNARVLSNRIENRDGTYRWVNNIYTAFPIMDNERLITELDSVSKKFSINIVESKIYYNYYFPKEIDSMNYNNNRFTFFEFENFRDKNLYHYRVDFVKTTNGFEIVNRKLYTNLNEDVKDKLIESIEKWQTEHTGITESEISILVETEIERNLELNKFMVKSSLNQKIFGYINIDTHEIILVK